MPDSSRREQSAAKFSAPPLAHPSKPSDAVDKYTSDIHIKVKVDVPCLVAPSRRDWRMDSHTSRHIHTAPIGAWVRSQDAVTSSGGNSLAKASRSIVERLQTTRRADCASAPELPVTPTSPKLAVRRRRPSAVSLTYPLDGSDEFPTAFGAQPHLPQPQFANGDSLPSSPQISRPGSQAGSRTLSQTASRTQSKCGSRRASAQEERSVIGVMNKSASSGSIFDKPRVGAELQAKLTALRHTGRRDRCQSHLPNPPSGPDGDRVGVAAALETGSCEASDVPPNVTVDVAEDAVDNQMAMLSLTLSDTTDTQEVLKERIAALKAAGKDVQALGFRHATACTAERSLAVCKAKLKRLQILQGKMDAYTAGTKRRVECLWRAHDGADPQDVAADAGVAGFKAFLAKCVHDGNPQDANKSDFNSFLQAFGLPTAHVLVIAGKTLQQESSVSWGLAALEIAHKVSKQASESCNGLIKKEALVRDTANGVARMSSVCHLAGLSSKDATMAELTQVEDLLFAEAESLRTECIIQFAAELREVVESELTRDQERELNHPFGDGQSALHASNRVQNCLSDALNKGVAVKHENIAFAREAKWNLLGEALFRNARAEFQRDAEQFEREGWIAEAAVEGADRVEKEIQRFLELGLSKDHPKVTETKAKAKELREQEGLRKRQANAAKRRSMAGGAS